MRPPAKAPRSCAPPNSVLTVVFFLRWASFLIADVGQCWWRKVHELNFPWGNRGARRCVDTPRAPSPCRKGPTQGGNASSQDGPLKSRTTADTYERLRDNLKGSV